MNRLRHILAAGAALAAATSLFVLATPAHAATVRDSIVAVAQGELAATSRNYEANGDGSAGSTNCTYYNGQMTSWPACGPAGWGWRGGSSSNDDTYAWCANFARYVWRQAGVGDLSRLNAYADSFYNYGLYYGTWHPAHNGYIPQRGDAIVFDWNYPNSVTDGDPSDDHVGLVISYSGGTITTIEGNTSDRVMQHTRSESDVSVRGFASPADAGSSGTGGAGLVHEVVGLSTGWADGILPSGIASNVSALMDNGMRRVYAAENGQLHEIDALSTGWSDGTIGGSQVTSVSAVMYNGVRVVYTIQSGQVHEWMATTGGWSDGVLPVSGASAVSALIDAAGVRRVYTIQGGVLHEASGLSTGWSDAAIGGGGTSGISAIYNGTRVVYTVQSGQVHEWVATNAGWSDGVLPVSGASAVSAVIDSGMRRVYTIQGGALHEASGLSTGWSDAQLAAGSFSTVGAVMDGTLRRVYAA